MAKQRMDLSAFVGKLLAEEDGDVLREGGRVLAQALMEAEAPNWSAPNGMSATTSGPAIGTGVGLVSGTRGSARLRRNGNGRLCRGDRGTRRRGAQRPPEATNALRCGGGRRPGSVF